jgi:hypothetical protein
MVKVGTHSQSITIPCINKNKSEQSPICFANKGEADGF